MKQLAIVVDDVELNREILSDMLSEEYEIAEASNGADALSIIIEKEEQIAVLLLDLMMPVMDGMTLLQVLKEKNIIGKFPILIISSEEGDRIEANCLSVGATDFIKKPFNPTVVRHRVRNSVALFTYTQKLEKVVEGQTQVLRKQAAALKEQNLHLEQVNERTIELMANMVEARDTESGMHVKRVKGFTRILAKCVMDLYPEYGLTEEKVKSIAVASAMHDIGKIMVPDNILTKPGKLTPEEFEIMKKHSEYGVSVLEKNPGILDEQEYELGCQICRHHHEKWDGRGYPDGLAGDEIPIAAQVVAIADCYDALTTERVYKKAFTMQEAYDMIMGGQCGQFNPKILRCLTEVKPAFEMLRETITD